MNPQEADRVRKNKHQDPKRSFGLSSSLAFLVWAVMGTLLSHILECNFLTILIKPNYEKPVDTAQDQPGPLSLVEECRGSALIGRE